MTHELPDIIAKNLDVLFCGINPGLAAAAAGQHFVGRSNRFWQVLHRAGFTPEEMSSQQDHLLLEHGYGITSVVARATASAAELSSNEFIAAMHRFEDKVAQHRPRFVAFLGKAAYAGMMGLRTVDWGRQSNQLHGAVVWVLPNPSGRNRSFALDRLVSAYRDLYLEVLATLDDEDHAKPTRLASLPRARSATR